MSSEQEEIREGDLVQRPSLNRGGPVIRKVVGVEDEYFILKDSQGKITFVRRATSHFRVYTQPEQYPLFGSDHT